MANPITQIIITAVDRTKAIFTSVKGGLASLGSRAAGLASQLGLIFTGLSVAGFVGALKNAVDKMDEAYNAAQKIGTSVENFSALSYAAEQSNVPIEMLQKSMFALAGNLDIAKEGSGKAAEAFAKLQIDPRQFSDPADALLVIAERFAAMPDGVNKTALAIELFGRKIGPELIPFLNEGRAGIEALKNEAIALGVVLDGEAAKAANDFNDNLDKLKASGSGLGIAVAKDILPGLKQVTDAMAAAAKDGGILNAAWVGLGGLGAAIFTDDLLTNTQKLAKAQNELAKAADGARRAGIGDTGYITRKRAEVKLLEEQVAAETKLAKAKDEASKTSAAAAAREEAAQDARAGAAESFKKSVNEQIGDAQRLQGALQSAFTASTKAEEDYLKQAKKLRADANGGAAGDGPEAQALAALDATIAAMKLQRTAATESLDSVQQQAEALRTLADGIEDVAKKESFRRQANLAEATALERAGAEEKARYQGIAEQQDKAARESEYLKASLDAIGKTVSVEVTPGTQMEKTKQDLTEIKHLLDYIKANPVAVNVAAGQTSSTADTLRDEARKYGRR